MAAKKKGKGRSITGFRFFDRDPLVYVAEAAREKSGLSYQQVAEKSNGMVTEGTLRNWEAGKVKSPLARTIAGSLMGSGYRIEAVNGVHRIEVCYSGARYESDRPYIIHHTKE